jgi:transcriptional regulator with XRE-family HTH domain
MIIGDRLRVLREQKQISQGEIEKRTGLLRCYVSRVENGHTVPAVETLEKFARALEVPLYQLFYEGEGLQPTQSEAKRKSEASAWGHSGRDARILTQFRELLSRANDNDRRLLLHMAKKMARRKTS